MRGRDAGWGTEGEGEEVRAWVRRERYQMWREVSVGGGLLLAVEHYTRPLDSLGMLTVLCSSFLCLLDCLCHLLSLPNPFRFCGFASLLGLRDPFFRLLQCLHF
jgi:hypothetical protein